MQGGISRSVWHCDFLVNPERRSKPCVQYVGEYERIIQRIDDVALERRA